MQKISKNPQIGCPIMGLGRYYQYITGLYGNKVYGNWVHYYYCRDINSPD
ncbi:hypothetical protein UF75_0019 [Desulfosporosinus sp. I2]|nr:hypothetical protein UF75_0019 [Desulfosporosinus sp. I2]